MASITSNKTALLLIFLAVCILCVSQVGLAVRPLAMEPGRLGTYDRTLLNVLYRSPPALPGCPPSSGLHDKNSEASDI
ncbi:hypothetical protein V2J09_013708 [Rumex salicifolius]